MKIMKVGHRKDFAKEEKECSSNMGRYNLNRLLYSCLLATPSYRCRIKIPRKEIPNIDDVGPFWPLSKATINAKCSEHVEDLFDLAYRPKHFAREHAVPKRHSGQGPFPGGHWAAPGALTAPMKLRISHLAVPRLLYTKGTKKYYGRKLTEKRRKLLDVYIDNAKKTVYYRPPKKRRIKQKPCNKTEGLGFQWPRPKPKAKKPVKPVKQGKHGKQVKQSVDLLSKLAAPKTQFLPPEINRGKKVAIEEITEALTKLATLPKRMKFKRYSSVKFYKVKQGALKYNITDRMVEIAQPRPNLALPPRNPQFIPPAALHYQVSDRVKKLATPRIRKENTDDLKEEDPFVVKPIALVAMCTPRTAELALPVSRK